MMTPACPCPRCGSPLGDAADGLCLVCAGRLALETRAEEVEPNAPELGVRLGDYELLAELGRGAMGVVFRARQLSLKRIVALKVVLNGQFASEAERRRFLSEVELAATLDHPNIVPVHDVGSAEGRPFCAMKLIEGQPLAQRIAPGSTRIPEREAAARLARVARAVHHAHQRGIIHRDLKPANILVDAAGEPHITDFGLARRLGAESSLSLTGSPLGTPTYMSPEQARGEKTLTTAADIWSLGVILYELLAGRPPFTAENVPALLRKIVEEELEPLTIDDLRLTSGGQLGLVNRKSGIVNPTDPDLATICLKCLEKEPARRYASAAELADDLERWQRHEPILARRSTAWERSVKWCTRHPHRALMLALLLAVFLTGLSGIVWQWQRAERETRRVRETAAREAAALLRNEAAKDAFLEQARAFRASGQPGQRLKALEALAAAARIRPAIELRNEALAALALPDLQPAGPPLEFPDATRNVGFDADVRLGVSVGIREELRLIHLADGALRTNWPVRGLPSGWLNLSPDGAWLSARDLREAAFWNVASGQLAGRFPARLGMKHHPGVEFSPDSRRVAIADGRETIAIVEAHTGEVMQEIQIGGVVDAFAFSPEGRHLAVLAGRALQIRSSRDGGEEARFVMPPGSWVSWQADGARLFVSSPDRVVRVVEPAIGTVRGWTAPQGIGCERAVPHARGALLATSSPGRTGSGLWDAATGRFLFSFPDGAFHFSRDGRRLGCVRRNEGLAVWNVIEADAVRSLPGPTNAVLDLDTSPDGRWLAAVGDDGVRLWKLASGQEVDFAPLAGLRTVAFAADGSAVLAQGASHAWRWPLRVKDRRFYHETGFGEAQANAASFAPAAAVAQLTAEIVLAHRIRLTDTRTGELLAELASPDGRELRRVLFSRDGQRLVALAEDGLLHVWDLPRLRAELAALRLDWSATNAVTPAAQPAGLSALTAGLRAMPPSVPRPVRRDDGLNPLGAPHRDPKATADQIDLTHHYNALLTELNWIDARAGVDHNLKNLPQGLQRLAGVTFDVRAIVQLASTGTRQYSDDYPPAVTNISIRRVCRRLHFLTAACVFFPIDPPGLRVGHYLMRYADGQTVETPLQLDEEIGMWIHFPKLNRRAELAEVAWTGEDPWAAKLGGSLQLFKWTWENPHPEVELTSLDFVSAMTPVAPFLIAITAE